jgi:hypothetical protein
MHFFKIVDLKLSLAALLIIVRLLIKSSMKMINQKSKVKSQKYNAKVKSFFMYFVVSFFVVVTVFNFLFFVSKAQAATGINRQINFQGKLVDNSGLNVADNSYTVVFSLYSVSSGGSNVWTETDSVTTKAGIFQVQLGVNTPLPDNVYFNSDSLYLGIKVGSDAEMTPRIRFTAVPYAINSASLDGVVATQSASGFTLTGGTSNQKTLTLNDNMTFNNGGLTFANGRSVTVSGADITIGSTIQPTNSGGLTVDTNGASTLALGASANAINFGGSSNPSYLFNGTGGLTIDGTSLAIGNTSNATIQTANGSNAGLTFLSQGSGNIILGQNAGNGNILITPNAGGQAGLILADQGSGDLFSASAGAVSKFTVQNDGTLVDAKYTGNNAVLFGTASTGVVSAISATSAGNQCLLSGANTTAPSWGSCALGTNYLQLNTNSLSPSNSTYDFLLGGNSTTSAKFAFINNAGLATPVASISAQNGPAPSGLSMSPGAIQSLNMNSLTIGGSTTGNVQFYNANNFFTNAGNLTLNGTTGINLAGSSADLNFTGTGAANRITTSGNDDLSLMPNGTGQVGVNVSSNLLASFDVRGNSATTPAASVSAASNYAAMVVNNSGNGDIFTASSSGATKFTILNNGNIAFAGTNNVLSTLASAATSAQIWTLPNATGTICVGGQTCASSGIVGYLQRSAGALSQSNITDDFLLGALATTSAKFGFLNVAGGTPTASISANIPNSAAYLTGAGVLGTTNAQTLQLGSSSTGSIVFIPGAATAMTIMPGGSVGIGTPSPLATLDIRGNSATTPVASFSATSNFAAIIANNSGTGDLFTASKSGASKFVITNAGNVGIGTTIPNSLLQVAGAASISGQFTVYGTSQIQSAENQTLNIGGTTTGNIQFSPGNSSTSLFLASNGSAGIGATTPLATLDVRANSATTAIASVSGASTFAGLVVNNSGTGDLFTASSAGRTKFTVTNNGNIFIGGDMISASSSGSVNNGSPDFINTLPDQGSLIPNAGFEASTSAGFGFADGWVRSATSSGAMSVDSQHPAQGSNDIQITLAAGGSAAMYSSCIPINGIANGGSYEYDNYVKSSTGSPVEIAYVDGYSSKAACTSNGGMAISNAAVVTGTITANYKALTTTAAQITPASGTTWGRVHLYFESAQITTINVDGARLWETTNADGLDYAEDYPTDPNNVPQPGDVVALEASNSSSLVIKADSTHQSVLGVVSTKPGEELNDGSVPSPYVPVALAGRVPVNVSTANGPIQVGDYLTSSDMPGVAVKAISTGPVIGTAMENYDCNTTLDAQTIVSGDPCQGQVTMFIKNTWYDPTVASTADGNYDLLKNSDLSVFDSSSSGAASDSGIFSPLYTIQTGAGIAVTSTTALAQATIANIQAGAVVAKELSTDSLNVTTGNIMVGGQTINDYITAIVKQVLSEQKNQPAVTVSVNGLTTATGSATLIQNIISQQDLTSSVSGMTVSDVLGANTIDTTHIAGLIDLGATTVTAASVSAQTIIADTIIARHISGLDILTTGLQKDDARITALENLVATPSAAPVTIEQPTISPEDGITLLPDTTSSASVSGDLHVKGNGLIEGILHVVDTLFANNFIANGVSDFFGNVIFHSGVTFEKTPIFNSDTAGIAVIKEGTDHIDVTFSKDYDQIPVVNASITLNPLTPTPSETPDAIKQRQNDLEKTLLAEDIRFVITNRTVHGFTILLEKPADEDIAFSWLALSVQNPVIFQNTSLVSPTPAETLSPSPIESIIPSGIAVPPIATSSSGASQ